MTHPFANLGVQIIASLGAVSVLSVTRRAVGAYVSGIRVPGAISVFSVDAVVQPSKPKTLKQLPEEERTTEEISVWTIELLQSSDVDNQIEADLLSWHGKAWKVVSVEDWNDQAQYGKAVARRVGP